MKETARSKNTAGRLSTPRLQSNGSLSMSRASKAHQDFLSWEVRRSSSIARSASISSCIISAWDSLANKRIGMTVSVP